MQVVSPSGFTIQDVKFDWYSFTPELGRNRFLDKILSHFLGSYLEIGRGRMGFATSDQVFLSTGELLCTVYHNQSEDCHVVSTGELSNSLGDWIRAASIPHLVGRIDLAFDYYDGDFDRLRSLFIPIAHAEGVKSRYIGPAVESADPEAGRTIYFGSRSSVGMIRVYEKGKQLKCKDHPCWTRVEFEFKPQNKLARESYSTASIEEILASTKISRAIFPLLSVTVPSVWQSAGTVRRDPDHERALGALKKQYQKTLTKLLHDVDYDSDAFVMSLIEVIT